MRWLAIVGVVGCASGPQGPDYRPLSEIPDALLTVVANNTSKSPNAPPNQFYDPTSVTISVAGQDCATVADDIGLSLAGAPLTITRTWHADAGPRAYCISNLVADVDPNLFVTQPAHIEIYDDSATWTVDVPGLAADVTIGPLTAGGTSSVTWNGGPAASYADLDLSGADGAEVIIAPYIDATKVHLHDNTADFDLPDDLGPVEAVDVELTADLTPGPVRDAAGATCSGPVQCMVTSHVEYAQNDVPVTQP